MRTALTSVAAAVLAFGATAAQADTVEITGFTFNPASVLSVATPSYTGQAGQFSGLLNGNSFTTYCTDLLQNLAFGVQYTDYTVVDGNAAWGAAKATMIGQLLTAVTKYPNYVANPVTSAVIQAGIWEILYETSGTYGFNSGSFQVSSPDITTQARLSDINWNGFAGYKSMYKVDQLYSRSHQDFLVVTEVPEPSTYALMAAGLAGIGFVARRRAQRQQ